MKLFLITVLIPFFVFAEESAELTERLKSCSNTEKKSTAIRKFIQKDCQLLDSISKSEFAKMKKGAEQDSDTTCQKLLAEAGLKDSLPKELSASVKADHSSQDPKVILFFLSKLEQENKKSIECTSSTITEFYVEKVQKLEADLKNSRAEAKK